MINLLFIVLALGFALQTPSQPAISRYKIVNKISLPGNDGWDYCAVDEAMERLFVSHGSEVQVVDLKSGKLIGSIPDTKGVHGIALAPDLNKGFISNGRDTSVTIFNYKTLETITKIKVTGINPDAILYDEFTHRIFTFNGKSSNATVMDANTNHIIGTILLDGKPEFSVSDHAGKLFVNIEDKSEVCVINPATLKVDQTWKISPGAEPSGMAMDRVTHRLFCVCDNQLMVILNSEDGKVIATLPIGERVDGCAFDPDLNRIYSSNGVGTLTVVQEENENKFSVLETVVTAKGARTLALDSKTHHIYLPAAEYLAASAPSDDNPNPRPSIKSGTFVVLEVAPVK